MHCNVSSMVCGRSNDITVSNFESKLIETQACGKVNNHSMIITVWCYEQMILITLFWLFLQDCLTKEDTAVAA